MGIFDKKKNSAYDEEDEMFVPVAPQPTPAVKQESAQSALKMKMVKPKKLSEAPEIADSLKAGHTVVLNLDELSDVHARRMLDYIAGVIYAVNGKIERPSDRTFLLTPKGVTIDSGK